MAIRSLNRFRRLRLALVGMRKRWLARRGVRVADSATVSLSSRFVTGGGDILVGEESLVAFKTLLITLTLDGRAGAIRIGRRCFIGGGAVVLPGVTIGDQVIVAAGRGGRGRRARPLDNRRGAGGRGAVRADGGPLGPAGGRGRPIARPLPLSA